MVSMLCSDYKCSSGSEGRESIKDEPRSERPSTSKTDNNMEKVRALVRADRWLSANDH